MGAQAPPSSGAAAAARRRWALAAVVVAIGFVALVVSSARDAAVPVGAADMGGMATSPGRGSDRVRMSIVDVDGRTLRVPGRRPGAVVFVEPRSCAACLAAVRAAARALGRGGSAARLTVVNVDWATSRNDVRAFARQAGEPPVRYVVDDRNGSLASMFGASNVGGAVVYDSSGRVVARPTSTAAIRRALLRVAE